MDKQTGGKASGDNLPGLPAPFVFRFLFLSFAAFLGSSSALKSIFTINRSSSNSAAAK